MKKSQIHTALADRMQRLDDSRQFTQGTDINTLFDEKEKTLWLLFAMQDVLYTEDLGQYFARPVSAYVAETIDAMIRVGALACGRLFESIARLSVPPEEFTQGVDFSVAPTPRVQFWRRLTEDDNAKFEELCAEFEAVIKSDELMAKLLDYLDRE